MVLDDEAASLTNDSVVHVEFFTADINGWNVLRKTVEQVVGPVWSLIFFLVGGGGTLLLFFFVFLFCFVWFWPNNNFDKYINNFATLTFQNQKAKGNSEELPL